MKGDIFDGKQYEFAVGSELQMIEPVVERLPVPIPIDDDSDGYIGVPDFDFEEMERLRLAGLAEEERQRLAELAEQERQERLAEQERQRLLELYEMEQERLRLAELERQRLAELAEQERLAELERQRLAELANEITEPIYVVDTELPINDEPAPEEPIYIVDPVLPIDDEPEIGIPITDGGEYIDEEPIVETEDGGYIQKTKGIPITGYIYPYEFLAITAAGGALGFVVSRYFKQALLGYLTLIAAGLMAGSAIGFKVKAPVKIPT